MTAGDARASRPMTIRFRRVPGYYNRSTYHVDVDGQHRLTVVRVSDSTWNRSAHWAAYRPGVNWSVSTTTNAEARAERHRLHLTGDRTRELAVKAALRKLAAEEAKA